MIEKCPRLRLVNLLDLLNGTRKICCIVLDSPCLELLTIKTSFEDIDFKNVPLLRFVSLHLEKNFFLKTKGVDHSIAMLASSSQLQELHCEGGVCKVKSLTVKIISAIC